MKSFWSLNRPRSHSQMAASQQQESVVLAETFERHWQQLRGIAIHNDSVPTPDDVVAVLNLLDQLTTLISMELSALAEDLEFASLGSNKYDSLGGSEPSSLGSNPCLDILLSENILAHILAASRMPISQEQQDQLCLQQLKLYEALLDQSSSRARSLLSHQPFLKPLLDLLNECCQSDVMCNETKLHLVMLLNQLCSRLQDNAELLEIFFKKTAEDTNNEQFVIFSILLRFLHSEGVVGSRARDALLLCMALSKTHDGIGQYIAKGTNFCPHLATGLSGLYSRMPRRFDDGAVFTDPSWYRLSQQDLGHLPEVQQFLSTLEFCDAVIQVAHDSVRQHLIGLIYMGFLVPVLGPALTQSLESELICSTAYVELFIRKISEPRLLAVFLRFIFTDTHEGKPIIDILVDRLGLQSQLCTVSLALFETLIGLNCEDVMLWLIFRHLIPQTAFLPSQRATIRHPDIHGRAAEKLIQLTPICCLEAKMFGPNGLNNTTNHHSNASLSSSLPTFLVGLSRTAAEDGIPVDAAAEVLADNVDYHSYLMDARNAVRDRFEATRCWQYHYDGNSPPHNLASAITASNGNLNNSSCDNNNDNSTPLGSSGPVSLTEEEDKEFWNLMRSEDANQRLHTTVKRIRQGDNLSLSSGGNLSWTSSSHDEIISPRDIRPEDIDNSICTLGSFLDLLFEKVELMPTNNLATNLLVTSTLTQLASYPQPLLRAVLIHPDIVLQPSVRGLFTAIASLRQKLDNIMPTLVGADEAMVAAKKYLNDRLTVQSKRRDSNVSVVSTITHLGNEARATKNSLTAAFSSMFRGKKSNAGATSSPTNASSMNTLSSNDSALFDNTINTTTSSSSPSSSRLSREVKRYAMAAVLLEEWLQELAAIAQEQSVLMKENAFQVGMAIDSDDNNKVVVVNNKKSAMISPTNNTNPDQMTTSTTTAEKATIGTKS